MNEMIILFKDTTGYSMIMMFHSPTYLDLDAVDKLSRIDNVG